MFEIAIQRANLIDRALAEYLEDNPINAPDIEFANTVADVVFKCPRCGGDMTLKDRRTQEGKFISCMNFPTCNNAIWLPFAVASVEVLNDVCNRVSSETF